MSDSQTETEVMYLRPLTNVVGKWHITSDLGEPGTPICRSHPVFITRYELTYEKPPEGALCQSCRRKVDDPYRQAKRQEARERQLIFEAQMEANRKEHQEKQRQRNQVYSTLEEFGQLPVESQLLVQMLRTIAWIRGYKAYWVVGTARDELGVNLTIDVVQKIGNEMPTQELLDRANEHIKNYFQQKVQNEG